MSRDPPNEVRDLFDQNARTYDRVNTVISLGLDARWRSWAARHAVLKPRARLLDAFAGTGLVGLRAAALGADVTLADISRDMLKIASRRAVEAGLSVHVAVTDMADAVAPLPEGPFDAITMVFGARYLEDPARVIARLASLLPEDGTFVLVEFVEPHGGGLVPRLAAAYFFRLLPRLAGFLAGNRELYDKLAATTHAMGDPSRLVSMARDAGLEVLKTRSMGFGLVCGVIGRPSRATPG